ncbi:hypothetical protein [Saccharopolyspora cebuensis]|uniref:Uncharacterized protein n=1 Tax=Saccharopolyspora cebuensis TaxID=418759 RepID=A0ABV4CQ85_9PSEU
MRIATAPPAWAASSALAGLIGSAAVLVGGRDLAEEHTAVLAEREPRALGAQHVVPGTDVAELLRAVGHWEPIVDHAWRALLTTAVLGLVTSAAVAVFAALVARGRTRGRRLLLTAGLALAGCAHLATLLGSAPAVPTAAAAVAVGTGLVAALLCWLPGTGRRSRAVP